MATNLKIHDESVEIDSAESASEYGSLAGSSSTSLSSSVAEYVYENGRRYQHYFGDNRYSMPNDELEQDRLDVYHHMQSILMGGKMYLAPVENPQRVLDAGTGTGIWALDMGDAHPSAEVIGCDISPIQPGWVAPNVSFFVDDLEKGWTWPKEYFDFIHARALGQGIRDWTGFLEKSYEHLKPGGWFEVVETEMAVTSNDGTYKPGTAVYDCVELAISSMAEAGLTMADRNEHARMLKEAGFVDVQIVAFPMPWGTWVKGKKLKEIGAISALLFRDNKSMEAVCLFALTKFAGIESSEAVRMCAEATDDVLSHRVHCYNHNIHVFGRKPENSE